MFINAKSANAQNTLSEAEAQMLMQQHETVKEFFRRDSSVEIVNSLNTLVETFLFAEDLDNVTPEMRVHIANQLRVVTLITELGEMMVKC
ncbi:hypothetical protein MUK70_26485 [Dyadobacter chenwenxiniae]|uniref:Uncharacterized protein n=1 Tax=Dyadobacter chenwenxiniae TaxID=2906456 RepID=A0A9X1PPP5_9BACT|nr:hypothetical protein [Dyadobacter chenwenxiniae]MCF0064220.1 hypothetical protein [Dyadobacter chenwenxiniae]UON82564.1 hypothetical protein MUK70_26485 [Dyadobacter chenwenxiniae]